jgi:hypothetical protein
MIQTKTPHEVAVVVDPAYGDKLLELAARLHVWIIDTPANKAAAQVLWSQDGHVHSLDNGVTTFSAFRVDRPDEIVASMLETIDLHHGEYSHSPPWSVLEVYGASPSPSLAAALADYGFTDILPILGGFRASRSFHEADNISRDKN